METCVTGAGHTHEASTILVHHPGIIAEDIVADVLGILICLIW